MLSDKIFRIHPEPTIDRKFFVAVFNSRVMRSQIERAISGAEGLANNLPQSAMKNFFCVIPPISEQSEIVTFLVAETAKFDALTAEAQRAIDLLQERRTALISAAVTGQIDVRGVARAYPGNHLVGTDEMVPKPRKLSP
jgi:type I restriction enzyme S subunit